MDEIETLAFCDQGTKKTESNPFCTITFPQKHILKKKTEDFCQEKTFIFGSEMFNL